MMQTQTELLPALQFTPPVLSLDFEALEERIDGIIEQYDGLIVSEDDVPAIKAEMAGLNHLARQLGDARKDAAAIVSKPIKDFEDKIKSLEKKIIDVRGTLDEQVKAHIQRERDSRRHKVQVTIDILKNDNGVPDLDIPIQESWLNKTAREKQIAAEVQSIILKYIKEQADAAALEQAKKDRATAIENHNTAMANGRGYILPVSMFYALNSLDMPLADALKRIEDAYEKEDARRTEAASQSTAPTLQTQPAHFADFPEPVAATSAPVSIRAMTITATYQAENGPQIGSLYQQIRTLCVTCTASVKDI